jgi:general secretion pathway protein I
MIHVRSDGFTLIEVLIALAIASVALITALKTFGHSADVTSAAHERFLASLSAENSLHEVSAVPSIGESSFACPQARRPFICQRSVIATPHPNFFRIEITVRDDERRILARRIGFYAKDMP